MNSEIIPPQNTPAQTATDLLVDVAGQLAPRSRRVYASDARHWIGWLTDNNLSLETCDRSDFIRYRQHLADTYQKVTAARMLSVARRLCAEAVVRGIITSSPAESVRGFKGIAQETTHRALTRIEAREFLAGIDRSTKIGIRDHALILLLLRTGLRRSEAAGLQIGDLTTQHGHHVALVRHGKGDARRIVKLENDVRRVIGEYMVAVGRTAAPPDAPLFVTFDKGDHPTQRGMRGDDIGAVVVARARAAGLEGLSAHGLRATFVTLALEGGARLQQVQYFVGHLRPETTERYQKRKLNLDDSASSYIRL